MCVETYCALTLERAAMHRMWDPTELPVRAGGLSAKCVSVAASNNCYDQADLRRARLLRRLRL